VRFVDIEETGVLSSWTCGLREKKLQPIGGVLGVVGAVAAEVGFTIWLGVGSRCGTITSALVAKALEVGYQ